MASSGGILKLLGGFFNLAGFTTSLMGCEDFCGEIDHVLFYGSSALFARTARCRHRMVFSFSALHEDFSLSTVLTR